MPLCSIPLIFRISIFCCLVRDALKIDELVADSVSRGCFCASDLESWAAFHMEFGKGSFKSVSILDRRGKAASVPDNLSTAVAEPLDAHALEDGDARGGGRLLSCELISWGKPNLFPSER
eukprot:scaffold15765_cov78-Skeletonema_marinoi.AAC.2